MEEHRAFQQTRGVWGRRKGPALSAHQTELLASLLPKLELRFEPGRDPKGYFAGSITDVWLEIGFGAGEHLLWQAEHNPHAGLIGAEPYISGMAKLLSKLSALSPARGEGALPNIRLYSSSAHDILAALPDASLARVFLLFPDPWPKKRHHKRRFIQMESLSELARVMKPGAEFRFATDDAGYMEWGLERLMAHPKFEWLAECAPDWRARPSDWPQTRYEAKAIRQGRSCTYLRFKRRP